MDNVRKNMIFIISLVTIAFGACISYFPPILKLIIFVIAIIAFLFFMVYLVIMKIPISMIMTVLLVGSGGLS
jgi:hypothetical protein